MRSPLEEEPDLGVGHLATILDRRWLQPMSFMLTVPNISNSRTNNTRFAMYFKALSNPHRLELFEQLSNCCAPGTVCSLEAATRCVGELGKSMNIAKSTLSHHLKELHQAGLISMERKGKQVMCSVNPEILQQISSYFSQNLPSERHQTHVKQQLLPTK